MVLNVFYVFFVVLWTLSGIIQAGLCQSFMDEHEETRWDVWRISDEPNAATISLLVANY